MVLCEVQDIVAGGERSAAGCVEAVYLAAHDIRSRSGAMTTTAVVHRCACGREIPAGHTMCRQCAGRIGGLHSAEARHQARNRLANDVIDAGIRHMLAISRNICPLWGGRPDDEEDKYAPPYCLSCRWFGVLWTICPHWDAGDGDCLHCDVVCPCNNEKWRAQCTSLEPNI